MPNVAGCPTLMLARHQRVPVALILGLISLAGSVMAAGAQLGDRFLKRPVKTEVEIEYMRPGEGSDNPLDPRPTSQGFPSVVIPAPSTNRPNGRAQDLQSEPTRSSCVICLQMMPTCQCAHPEACIYVPQTCGRCAHYICSDAAHLQPRSRSRASPTTTSTTTTDASVSASSCVDCPAGEPRCRCGPNQRCVIIPRTCHECARVECREIDDSEGSTSTEEDISYEQDQEIEYDEADPAASPSSAPGKKW